MTSADFDKYREDYPTMDYETLVEWHSRLYDDHPMQQHYDVQAVLEFFKYEKATSVLEIGGWRGELADAILLKYPEIESWENYEICVEARDDAVCHDGRYVACDPQLLQPGVYDTVVMSHVMEHLGEDDIEDLLMILSASEASRIYVDCPITPTGEDWEGQTCFHVLTRGWNWLHEQFGSHGFHQYGQFSPQIRYYRR